MRTSLCGWVCILLLFFVGLDVRAAQPLTLLELNEREFMIPFSSLQIWEDTSRKMPLHEVLRQEQGWMSGPIGPWRPEQASYWVRFSVRSRDFSQGHWLVEVLDAHVGHFEAYIFENGQLLRAYPQAGYDHPFADRGYRHKNFLFEMPVPQQGEGVFTFYFRYDTKLHNAFVYKVWKDSELIAYTNAEYYLLGLFYGVLLLLMVYNFINYFFVRERFYLYFVFFVFSCILVGFSEDGLGFQYIWPHCPDFNPWLLRLSPLLFLFSANFFMSSFISLHRHSPWGFKLMWGLLCCNLLYYFFFTNPQQQLWASPFFIPPFLVVFWQTARLFRKGMRQHMILMVGATFLLMGVLVMIFRGYGWLFTSSIVMVYSFNIGLILMVLFLSMALAERYRSLKEEKMRAQQQVIEELQAREQIISQKVVERTEQIARQRDIIEQKNEALASANERLLLLTDELQEQAEEIAAMNEQLNQENAQLNEENEQLQGSVKELTKAHVLKQEVDLAEFMRLFPDEEACYRHLADLKWTQGYSCRRCGQQAYAAGTGPFARRCSKCGYNESATNGTIFHRTHLPILKGFQMLFLLFANGGKVSSTELSQLLDIRQNTCWKFSKKVREQLDWVQENKYHRGERKHLDTWGAVVLAREDEE